MSDHDGGGIYYHVGSVPEGADVSRHVIQCCHGKRSWWFSMCHCDGSAPRERMFLGGDGLVWFGPMMTDMEFVINFTPSDFQAKNFTPSILPNFNSFSDKNTKK